MLPPARFYVSLAAGLILVAATYPAHGEEKGEEDRAAPPPAWYQEHNDFLTRHGGVFHADNSAYRSEDEPWEAYGMAWEKGPSRQTLRGRLFGIRDGKDAGTFWDFHVFWHPSEGKAFISQVGADGTLGMGTLEPPGADGAERSEATMYFVDGTTTRIAHVVSNSGDIHAADSFDWVDGSWQPRRSYVWHRVVPETATAPGDAGGREGSEGERGRLVDIGGRRLFLDCVGSGSPTVVIDGGAATWSIFYRHIQDDIAGDTRVCTYDRAGYGASEAGPAPRAAGALADDLHRLLRAAGESTPYLLVGHSLGGYVVRIYQRRHASEVAAMVLAESAHPEQWTRLPSKVGESVRDAVPQFLAAAEAARAGQITVEQLDPWAFQRHGTEHRRAYERAMLTPKPWLASAAELEAVEAGAAQVPGHDLGDLPLVVVTAGRSFDAFAGSPIPIEESNPVWLELQRELVGLSAASEHILSPDANHNIEQSDPAAFVEGIRRAIAAARARAAPTPADAPGDLSLLHRLPHTSTLEVDALLAGLEGAYRSMDVEASLAFFNDDVEQLDVNRRVLVRGARDWRRQTQDVNAVHVWMERNHHGRAVVGDRVVVEVEWAGRIRGEVLGTPGEDKEYRYVGLGLLDLRGGRIGRQILFSDYVSLVEQLGISERPRWQTVSYGSHQR